MHAWDAGQYLRFADQRTLPAMDLLGRIAAASPSKVVDLGCGPGNSTVILQQRWPDAEIRGIDFSEDMLATARKEHPGISFERGDISAWAPAAKVDVVFSNAALQWLDDHETLMLRLLDTVAPGGVLAVQMPRNHDGPAHTAMRRLADSEPWRERLAGTRGLSPVHPPEFYYDLLAPRCASLTLWETNYVQPMEDAKAIIAWLRGTGLRPYLQRLEGDDQALYLSRFEEELSRVFDRRADGKLLLPYPRLFFVATPKR